MHTSIFSTALRSRTAVGAAVALVATLAFPGCTKQQLEGLASSYMIIDSLTAASGAAPASFGGSLASDVLTFVKGSGTVFADTGQVVLRLALKDPGTLENPLSPSSSNFITVTRYRVRFARPDGSGTPGVDVPLEYNGATTGTVRDAGLTLNLTLVPAQAKFDMPLSALAGGGGPGFITTVAEVTFFGTDQAGRQVSVKGSISVIFADWADPS